MSSFRRKACINGLLGVLFCLALIALIAPLAYAQETTGSIEGRVSDATGGVVPGAAVKVAGATFNREVLTDDVGSFRVMQVPPGAYKLSASMTGFNTAVAEVTVGVGKVVAVDFALKVGDMSEQVIVSADNIAKIDPAETTVETNITTSLIDSLPKGVRMDSLLKMSPATRYEPNGAGYQVDGASSSENSFVIDGLEVSNFRTGALNINNNVPFEMVEEVLVKTSGFAAEFGGATGGVVNIITKSGGNAIHGEAAYEFAPGSLRSSQRPFLNKFRTGSGASFVQINQYMMTPRDDQMAHYPSFQIGGPLVKDRAWFFTSYAPQITNETRTTTYYSADPRNRTKTGEDTYHRQVRSDYFQGRVDTSPHDTLRVTGTYIWNPYQEDGLFPHAGVSIGGSPPYATVGNTTYKGHELTDRQGSRQNATNISTQAIWTPSSNFATSFRLARSFLNEKPSSYFVPRDLRSRYTNAPASLNLGYTGTWDEYPTGNSETAFDVSTRRNFEADASYILNGLGRHEFKVGYQHAKVTNDVDRGYAETGIVDVYYDRDISALTGHDELVTPGNIGSGRLIRYETVGSASNVAQSLYFQDRWQPIQRLSLNLGFRMEKEDLPSFNGYAPPINFGWFDKIVPRLGFAWDLTNDGKTKLFSSYARFQDRLRFELPRGSFGGDFYRVDFFEVFPNNPHYSYFTKDRIIGTNPDVFAGKCPITNSTGLSTCQFDYRIPSNHPDSTIYTGKVDPDMKPLTQEEFTVGLDREIARHIFSARYTYKNVLHAIEDAGFITAGGSEAYIIGNPGEGLHKQVSEDFGYTKSLKPQRRYDALELRVGRRFSSKYQYDLSYTYSRLYGNYSGLASTDENGRQSPGVNRFFDLPHVGFTLTGQPDNGPLPTDRPHVFKAFGSYEFDWFGKLKNSSTLFSVFTQAQQGTPITSYYTLFAAAVSYGRGNLGRSEAFTQTDFALSHRIKGGERYEARFVATVDNIFDEKNITRNVSEPQYTNPGMGTLAPDANNEVEALNHIITNGSISAFDTWLNDPKYPQRKDTSLMMGNVFQGERTVRLGFRFSW
ncbi:MAG: TonB-dependent receptor [Acidobacteria bacterium]|nr:MAG: TonB-dependent receptor [Acidobacteriota bacterium]